MALAIIATVLSSIGAVIGTTVQGTRTINQRLTLDGAAETLLAGLPGRNALRPGRQTGELAGHRWRIDVAPISGASGDTRPSRFVPLAVNMWMQGPSGAQILFTTVRLVPKATE